MHARTSSTSHKADIGALYDYADKAFDKLCEAWGLKPAQDKYALLVMDRPGGGFATGDIGEVQGDHRPEEAPASAAPMTLSSAPQTASKATGHISLSRTRWSTPSPARPWAAGGRWTGGPTTEALSP